MTYVHFKLQQGHNHKSIQFCVIKTSIFQKDKMLVSEKCSLPYMNKRITH